jgi:Subtilase family/PKD domain
MLYRYHAVALLLLLTSAPLYAGSARPGWTKVEITPLDGTNPSLLAALLDPLGAELVADYGAYAIAYAPDGAVAALQLAAAATSTRVRQRDGMDVLQLPGAALDTREGIPENVESEGLIDSYPSGTAGVYVLQLVAPMREEWAAELEGYGWTLSRYIPDNGYLVVGIPELVERTLDLDYVQWLDFFHPYQKATTLAGQAGAHDLVFDLPPGEASEAAVEAIDNATEDPIEVERGALDTLVFARMDDGEAEALLHNPMILSVDLRPVGELADGRQAQSLSPLLNTQQSQPTPPPSGQQNQYWNWVVANDHCPACANMPHATWKMGFADSGLDNGYPDINQFGQGHPDLASRKYFGSVILHAGSANDPVCPASTPFCCPADAPLCDMYRHGTLVAGIAAGSGAGATTDAQGFLLGLGGAPTAGMFMTKIRTRNTGIDPTLFSRFTADAAANGLTVQNHSWESSDTAGTYTGISRKADIAARDADDATPAREPLLLTIAAGNDGNVDNDFWVTTSPLGMAKNALTLGGLENYRPDANSYDCRHSLGDSFRNIMNFSRVGNSLPGYIKPDLMAPASLITSAHMSTLWPDPEEPPNAYCLKHYTGDMRYSGDSGTSFAAPLGAAASMIVKRYLGNSPADTSPALIKATLIAGARSVRGGLDRTKKTVPATTIGPVPSAQQQGFGRLTLEDILNGNQKPVYFDQSTSRLFTAAGQKFCAHVRVHDAAKPAKVALVWTDTPATPLVTNPLVNDLNLEIRRSSNPAYAYVGNSLAVAVEANGEESLAYPMGAALGLDNVNNVEYFRSFLYPNEALSIAVKAWNIAGDTDGDTDFEQDFALVALNADLLSSGDCPPTAVFTVTCSGLTCTANASASTDENGITSYGWNWGDASTTNTSGPITTHTYTSAGTYNVVLTTTDTGGQSAVSAPQPAIACNPLGIDTQPATITIAPGETATLNVVPSGTGPFAYQWYHGESGATTWPVGSNASSFTTPPSFTTEAFWVRVTSTCGSSHSVDSAHAGVYVEIGPPGGGGGEG